MNTREPKPNLSTWEKTHTLILINQSQLTLILINQSHFTFIWIHQSLMCSNQSMLTLNQTENESKNKFMILLFQCCKKCYSFVIFIYFNLICMHAFERVHCIKHFCLIMVFCCYDEHFVQWDFPILCLPCRKKELPPHENGMIYSNGANGEGMWSFFPFSLLCIKFQNFR